MKQQLTTVGARLLGGRRRRRGGFRCVPDGTANLLDVLGSGWSHLANDDFNQILTGALQRIYFEAGNWHLVIEATMFVTNAVVDVWTGTKSGGPDPTGTYTRLTGCDPTGTLTIET